MLLVPTACLLGCGLTSSGAIATSVNTALSSSRLTLPASYLATVNLMPDFAAEFVDELSQLELAQGESNNSAAAPPTLSLDDSGEAVERLQRQLQAAGFYDGEITGVFDLDTDAAVSAFQEQEGLDIDGVMDAESWQRLQALQPSTEGPLNLVPPEEDPQQDQGNSAPGLGRLWWIGGGALLVVLAGGLFVLLLKAFAEEVDDPDAPFDDILEQESDAEVAVPPVQETPESLETATEDRPLADSDEPDPPGKDNSRQGSRWGKFSKETPPQAFPNLPSEPPTGLKEPTVPETTAIAPQNNSSSALTRLPRMSIVEALILDLQHPDPERRHKAIWELGQRGDSRAISPLVELLTDASSQERSTILAVLSEISSRNLKPMKQALMVSLQDDSAEVRKNAIRDLTRIYDSIAQLSQVLRYGTDDADPEVRETAKWAMSQLQRIRTLPLNSDTDDTP
ncbi:MAG: HEAT repeat domain-containing protein [Phormidium sp. BM_Day4_Bin.17]|nr:HEAT repeat domain-containing protein [Phormidium sp. BM_Day4_Bin.17]UCJ11441.1 MAG: HEAT repeat domain-containing protein [Phormidium sp. PBR-2020]